MGIVKTIGKLVGFGVGVVVVGAVGAGFWAKSAAAARLDQHFETHRVEIPVPFPLTEAEIAALRSAGAAAQPPPEGGAAPVDPLAGVDLPGIALQRAKDRGQHLVEARYACLECHGRNFGGGVMIDSPPIGTILGPNLTSGKGGRVPKYAMADWDRIVRHGVLPDGRPAAMPSEDFFNMSDRELSDIIAYLRAAPPVDAEVARPTLGPVGMMLMATKQMRLSAEQKSDHQAAHSVEAPDAEVTLAFGKHLVQICTGCHGATLAGGPVAGGDPSWPPARNLTLHADGLKGWAFEDFVRVMKEGKRKDGTAVRSPMSKLVAYGAQTTDTELKAMWLYLQAAPPAPSPK